MAIEDPGTGKFETASPRVGSQSTDGESAGVMNQVIDVAARQAEQAKDDFMDAAARRTKSIFSDQKDRAADGLDGLAHAFRQTGESLREQEYGSAAYYAERAAERVERVSSYMREGDLDSFIDDAQDFARRQPALVIGGALVLGFLAARLLQGSARETRAWSDIDQPEVSLSGEDAESRFGPATDEPGSTPYGAH